jgi:hypothetical protein
MTGLCIAYVHTTRTNLMGLRQADSPLRFVKAGLRQLVQGP